MSKVKTSDINCMVKLCQVQSKVMSNAEKWANTIEVNCQDNLNQQQRQVLINVWKGGPS